jgi:flagellar biosynthesis protein FlhB
MKNLLRNPKHGKAASKDDIRMGTRELQEEARAQLGDPEVIETLRRSWYYSDRKDGAE